MVIADRMAVGADTAVALHDGGSHLMLVGVLRELHPGGTVPLTLHFARSGIRTVTATIVPETA
jgi:copper(I)-binding protein